MDKEGLEQDLEFSESGDDDECWTWRGVKLSSVLILSLDDWRCLLCLDAFIFCLVVYKKNGFERNHDSHTQPSARKDWCDGQSHTSKICFRIAAGIAGKGPLYGSGDVSLYKLQKRQQKAKPTYVRSLWRPKKAISLLFFYSSLERRVPLDSECERSRW